jgi:hypothetical protein
METDLELNINKNIKTFNLSYYNCIPYVQKAT